MDIWEQSPQDLKLDIRFWCGNTIPGISVGQIFSECHDMLVPSTRTQLGRRSFHVAAPSHLERDSITAPLIIH